MSLTESFTIFGRVAATVHKNLNPHRHDTPFPIESCLLPDKEFRTLWGEQQVFFPVIDQYDRLCCGIGEQ